MVHAGKDTALGTGLATSSATAPAPVLPLGATVLRDAVVPGSDRAVLIDTPDLFAGVKVYEPGEEFANHYHEGYDEFFAVLEGEITVWTGRLTRTVLPRGSSLLCPRGQQHFLRNETGERTRLFYAKVPMVTDDSVPVTWAPPIHGGATP